MKNWLYQHWRAFGHAFVRLSHYPFGTLLSALVIGIALALPGSGFVLLENLAGLARGISSKPEISLFLAQEATPDLRQTLETGLHQIPEVATLRFISKEAAVQELAENGWGDVLQGLSTNPLPDAYVIGLNTDSPEIFESVRTQLQALPGVALVQVDAAWVRRLAALIGLGQTALAGLGLLLGIALVIITFNTIRLMILTQRPEIEVSRLLGATDALISRPFYWLGALQGFLGGLIAWGAVWGVVWGIRPPVQQLAQTYNAVFTINGPTPGMTFALIAAAIALGWLGSVISVKRNLAVTD